MSQDDSEWAKRLKILDDAEAFWSEPRRARLLQLRPDDPEALRILDELADEPEAAKE